MRTVIALREGERQLRLMILHAMTLIDDLTHRENKGEQTTRERRHEKKDFARVATLRSLTHCSCSYDIFPLHRTEFCSIMLVVNVLV